MVFMYRYHYRALYLGAVVKKSTIYYGNQHHPRWLGMPGFSHQQYQSYSTQITGSSTFILLAPSISLELRKKAMRQNLQPSFHSFIRGCSPFGLVLPLRHLEERKDSDLRWSTVPSESVVNQIQLVIPRFHYDEPI